MERWYILIQCGDDMGEYLLKIARSCKGTSQLRKCKIKEMNEVKLLWILLAIDVNRDIPTLAFVTLCKPR